MIRYVGMDVHKHAAQVCIKDEKGTTLHELEVVCTRDELLKFAREHLTAEDRLALEATTNTWGVVDVLEPSLGEIAVSNPLKTRVIAEASVKTDKVDAAVLADLYRTDYLPEVWIPDAETRRLRSLTHRRASLVSDRTGVKNRLHSVLHQRLIPAPIGELFGTTGRAWLEDLQLDELGRMAVDSDLRLLDRIDEEIDALDTVLAKVAYADPRARLLMTIPGVDMAVALTVLAAMGDPSRFKSDEHFASYLGLVPSTRQSADHCYHGPITKRGSSKTRWMLIQAAQHMSKNQGPLGHCYRKLRAHRNHNVAVVAVARKMAMIAWHMVSKNEPYRYQQPVSTQAKLQRLRVRATGERRRSGTKPGTPRSKNYGTGHGTKLVPSVEMVAEAEGVPAPRPFEELPAGEQRMIRQARLVGQVHDLHKARRVPKRRKAEVASEATSEERS